MGRLGAALTLVVASTLLATPAHAAKRRARPTCASKGSKTVKSTADVRVYSERSFGRGGPATNYVGCLKRVGDPVTLTSVGPDEIDSSTTVTVRIAGRHVAVAERIESGCARLSLCPADDPDGVSGRVGVTDLRRPRERAIVTPDPAAAFAVTRRGGLAVLSRGVLTVADANGTRVLDTGAIDGRTLRAETSIVSWARDGAERYARLAGGSATLPATRARHSCARKGSTTVARGPGVRVFTVPGRGDVQDRLYGCLTANGRRQVLAESSDDGYVNSNGYDDVRVAGHFVAWHSSATDASCKADCPPGYNPTREGVDVYDLRRRRTLRSSIVLAYTPGSLALTQGGALAWLAGTQVVGLDRAGARVLDDGKTTPASLRAETSIVSWLRDGAERFARLR